MDRILIGKNIKKFRKMMGLTQAQFAIPLGIKGSYVSDIEKGKSSPSESVILLLEIQYQLNRNWLFTGDGDPYINKDKEVDDQVESDGSVYDKDKLPEIEKRFSNLEARFVTLEETIKKSILYNKDRAVGAPGEGNQDNAGTKGLNPALGELINLLPMGEASTRQSLSGVLEIIVAGLKNTTEIKDLENKLQQLKSDIKNLQTQNEHFKIMERNTSQDYKDLANSVKQFMKKHISPEILDERRECMFDLENLMTGIENKLKKGNSPAE